MTIDRLVSNRYQQLTLPVVASEYSQTVEALIPTLRYDPYTDDIV